MPNPILTSRAVILAKVEVTYDTDAAPTVSADEVLIANPSWAHEGLRMSERAVVKPTFGPKQQVYGGSLKTISFDVEMKGSGTAGTAPQWGTLLEGCAFIHTDGASDNTYDPTSVYASTDSLTIWFYQDGLVHKMTGCRGNVSFNLETGSIPMASFTFTGHFTVPTTLALAVPVLDATAPVTVKNNSFTIDSFASVINALTFDMSNQVVTPPDMQASDGYGEIIIAGRDLNGSFDPQMVLETEEAYYGNFLSGTPMALATGTIGGTSGNRIAITMPAVYYRDAAMGDRDGVATYELPFGAVESSGDDEIQIVIT